MTIRARIRALIRDGHQAPQQISSRIIPTLTTDEMREALHAALPYLVRDEIRKFRHDAISPARDDEGGDPAHRWHAPLDRSAAIRRGIEAARRRRAAGQKAADASQATRDRNAALLRTPVCIDGTTWKTLGECTPEDLRSVAREHGKRAAENQRRADGFLRLADKLEQAGASTVAEYQQGYAGELREQFVGAT